MVQGNALKYYKVTCSSEALLADGYPPVTLMEINGDAVVRQVYVFNDGTAQKDSLDQFADTYTWSLAPTPSLDDNRKDNPGYVAEASVEEFENAWVGAAWIPHTAEEAI